MTIRIIALLTVLLPLSCVAQIPQFLKSSFSGSRYGYLWQPFDSGAIKSQCIYYPSDFVTMPGGVVKNIYLRAGNGGLFYHPDTIINSDVSIKIGYTTDSTFAAAGLDSFRTGLTLLYYATSHSFECDSNGKWLRFPCIGNWQWNGIGNFIVEFQRGQTIKYPQVRGYHGLMCSIKTYPNQRTLQGLPDSNYAYIFTDTNAAVNFDLGFDIAVLDVKQNSNTAAVGLFPNPSIDGRFNVSLNCNQALGDVRINVQDAIGNQVMHRSFANIGDTLFRELSIVGVAKGLYIVELEFRGERIIRKLVIQ